LIIFPNVHQLRPYDLNQIAEASRAHISMHDRTFSYILIYIIFVLFVFL